jgi:4-amino-4-deoxy-L-arabinose transferase-like glycosyltransferase
MKIKISHITIIIILLASLQYFLISTSSHIVFGDEGHYASLSRWISENHIIPEFNPYTSNDIMKTRTNIIPLFFIFETFGFYLGEFAVKLLLPIFSLLSAFTIYIIMKSKFENKIAGVISAITLLMTPAIITYGVMGYTDTLLLLTSILAIHFIAKSFDDNKKSHILMSGIFLALSLLTKRSALFLILFLIIYAALNKTKNMKIILSILVIAFILICPWLIRNIIQFSDPCFGELTINGNNCGPLFLETPEKIEGLQFDGRTSNTGTEASLLQFGILNYMRFAHGWTIVILLLLGIGYLIINKNKYNNLITAIMISTLPLIAFSTLRAEDTARYLLPTNIGIVMIVGLFSYKLYDYIKNHNKYIGYLIIVIILISLLVYGQEKIDTMKVVKQFSPGFIEGCTWVKENTPTNSIVLATYAHHTKYQCNRPVALANDAEEVFLSNDDTSYQHLTQNGVDYILVLKGLISTQKLKEHYPLEFINYIENSNKFENVYDNTDIYGDSGVIIYKVI